MYATKKLKAEEIHKLRDALDDLSFSCGADLQEASLPAKLEGVVYVRKMYCNEPIERLLLLILMIFVCTVLKYAWLRFLCTMLYM